MGDACEMLVVAELTLAGVPAVKMPDNWPSYDLTAYPKGDAAPQKISVKSRTFKRGKDSWIEYNIKDRFDWLAIVILPDINEDEPNRRVFICPKTYTDSHFHGYKSDAKSHDIKDVQIDRIAEVLLDFEDNFNLLPTGKSKSS